jgi:peptide/nickel transport system ATP-binding protein
MTSLNPVFKIGDQIAEGLMLHQGITKQEAREKVVDLLRMCGIPEARMRAASYPHELSGGMRQRAMIAMAIACNPKLLIADEPTTALDVTIQAQIIDLMRNLKKEIGSSILLITHNLGVVAEMCDHVAVMYAGNIVEFSNVEKLFKAPRHPYTSSLLRALPIPGEKRILEVIPGTVPNMIYLPSGCEFHPRCKHCMEICKVEKPILKQVEKDQLVACHLYRD